MQGSPFVNDLRWVVNSPSLIQSSWRPNHGLSLENIDAVQLTDFLNRRTSQRVGHYFEDLVRYYLVYHHSVDSLRCGVQIRENGRTIGELDFVYRNADSQLVHLETAVKFYLYRRSGEWLDSHYVGPNAKDTLERKICRLREHQTPLSDHPLARQQIASHLDERVEKNEWICGRIFYHPDDCEPKHPSPLLSADHLRGVWIRESELDWFDQQPATLTYRILRKPYWLSGICCEGSGLPLNKLKEYLCGHFANSEHPVMIASNESNSGRDPTCTVVVSDAWPLQK